jgi:hypothetical protein
MSKPDVVVSSVIRVEPDAVQLGDERRVRIDPERPETRGLVPILEGLRDLRMPVYLEIDPATSEVTRLLIPHVGRVSSVRASDDALEIMLDTSHAVHMLRPGAPGAEAHERLLREAARDGRVLIVTEDDSHYILDVREFRPGPDGELPPLPPFPEPEPPRPPLPAGRLRRFWLWPGWPWRWFAFGCVSPARAQQVFDAMAATTCDPLTVPPPCIPFMYPDDGCWGRAHEMCRLMIEMGVKPAKVWINAANGPLKADTQNNPQCYVQWGWHVAPTICVRRWWWCFLWPRRMVIDPSLFEKPVTRPAWKAVQNNPQASLTDTPWTYFWQSGQTDPDFSQTNNVLATYRLQLQLRSQSSVGPPPYAHCA